MLGPGAEHLLNLVRRVAFALVHDGSPDLRRLNAQRQADTIGKWLQDYPMEAAAYVGSMLDMIEHDDRFPKGFLFRNGDRLHGHRDLMAVPMDPATPQDSSHRAGVASETVR